MILACRERSDERLRRARRLPGVAIEFMVGRCASSGTPPIPAAGAPAAPAGAVAEPAPEQ